MNSTLKLDMLEFLVLAECAQVKYLPVALQFIDHVDPAIDFEDIDQITAATQRLLDKELVSEEGEVHEDAWNLLATFNQTITDFDLIYQSGPEEELRASVCCAGPLAIRLVTDGFFVELVELFPEDATSELLSLLPDYPPVEMPSGLEVDLEAFSGVDASNTEISDVVRGLDLSFVDDSTLERLNELFSNKFEGHGQLGVSCLDGDDLIRCDQAIKVFDLDIGRLGLWNEAGQRRVVSWSPPEVQRAWEGLALSVQAERRSHAEAGTPR